MLRRMRVDMGNVSERILNLPPEKLAMLLQKMGQKPAAGYAAASHPITSQPRHPQQNHFPLSFAQRRLWFLHQLAPDNAAYNLATALRLTGKLDQAVLERCLQELVQRHETLRTVFTTVEGEPRQCILPYQPLPLPITPLADSPSDQQIEQVEAMIKAEKHHVFNLTEGPLLRPRLLQLGPEEHIFLLTMHHIISDGWSMGILTRELVAVYTSLMRQQPSPLPPLPIQYADFAVWQQAELSGAGLTRALDYWKKHLAAAPALLTLPTDRPRPPVQTFAGAAIPFALSPVLTHRLKTLSRSADATLFMVLLAAFQLLIHRYTHQTDIVIGSPIANRKQTELEGLIGFFVNTLVLRTDFSGDPTFRELLQQLRATTLAAYAHQDLPFERLVEELRPQRDMSANPLVQIMFDLQNTPTADLTLPGITIQPVAAEETVVQFDLILSLTEMDSGLKGLFRYNTVLFDKVTISRMAHHFETLLSSVVTTPDQRVSRLPLLTTAEQHQLITAGNASTTPYQPTRPVPELVETVAASMPQAVAVTDGSRRLTYAELNEQANRLAHYLQKQGVGPDILVGICLERSLEWVISIVATLKAGGAYVPLDPTYPPERLSWLVQDMQAPVLLTQSHLQALLPEPSGTLICLDSMWPVITQEPITNLTHQLSPDNLAYLIYTSGSTGQPKGVAVPHRGLCNLVAWHQQAFAITPQDRATAVAGLGFDASVWEIWPYLTAGATLHLPDEETRLSPLRLRDWLLSQQITISFLPTPLAEAVLTLAWPQNTALRVLLTGGDRLRTYPDNHLPFTLVNNYGPTEASVVATSGIVSQSEKAPALPSIGRPISQTQIYLLDQQYQPVPVGVAGEIYIGGSGLARGYWQQPGLTAAKFIPNPFFQVTNGADQSTRLYKTGDLARYLPNGEIEFLGRGDHQVKLRGFRIELGEIEAALKAHPEVQEGVVLLREDEPEHKGLVAYVVGNDVSTEQTDSLRHFLAQRLPQYMVPAVFVFLEQLPLTPNGKVDREALPAPQRNKTEAYVPPQTPLEKSLARIWGEVLHRSQVGIFDNFFESGGHSLSATQIISRISETMGVTLPLRVIFESPTIQGLAGQITSRQQLMLEGDAAAISITQQRLWFLDQLESNAGIYQHAFALHLSGPLDAEALQKSVALTMERHPILRASFATRDGKPILTTHITPQQPLLSVDLSEFPEANRWDEAQLCLSRAQQARFDLTQDVLVHTWLIRLHDEEHLLYISMHQIISDEQSLHLFCQEIADCYAALMAGQPSDSPLPTPQYAAYVAWQHQLLQDPTGVKQLHYWQKQLAHLPPALALPTDYPRPATQTFAAATHPFNLPPDLLEELTSLGREEGADRGAVLLALFSILLYRYTKQADFLIGTPLSHRTGETWQHMLGPVDDTLVLRHQLDHNVTFRALLKQVQATILAAQTHPDIPFARLVEEAQTDRDLSRPPLVQVAFAWDAAAPYPPSFSGLAAAFLPTPRQTTLYDLSLNLSETAAGLQAELIYNRDLFAPETMARFAAHLLTLAKEVSTQPDQPIASYTLLSPTERAQILHTWNETTVPFPHNVCLHHLISSQARLTPEAVALIAAGQQLTYRELNEKANQVAHYLQALGVDPEVRVGICMERTASLLIALLGVLKAGGAYVPFDPTYPPERNAFILRDANVAIVLTQHNLAPLFSDDHTIKICLDLEWDTITAQAQDDPVSFTTAGNLAYVIYTSGSTGLPKGVAITHRNAAALLSWAAHRFAAAALQTVLAATSICFDLSVYELFLPLSRGGTILLVQDILQLLTLPERDMITLINTVPSAMAELVQAQGIPASVQTINLAGEPLRRALVHQIYERSQVKQVYNLYGPSEDTTYSTFSLIEKASPDEPTIGRPIHNTQAYILDEAMQPVPVHLTGELYLGGQGVARGYLNRPALTAARFVPDPFSNNPGHRLYRTGDLARYRADGSIEFLGRVDHQVKIRGYRIELGEIEARLSQHPGVAAAALSVWEDHNHDKRLVAYAAALPGLSLTPSELRDFLQSRLPAYMIPSLFIILDKLPLTPNGKINRRALPPPDRNRPDTETAYIPPHSPTEKRLAAVWAQILGVDQIGRADHFFELGGHSLLATRVVSHIRQAFAIELPLRDLFEAPTLEQLAERIESQQHSVTPGLAASILPAPRPEHIPLSFSQQRLWLLDQITPHNPAYQIPGAVQLFGPLKVEALYKSLAEIVQRHEILRTTFPAVDGEPGQVINHAFQLEMPVVDLSHLSPPAQKAAARQVAEDAAAQPFDLATGPLLRVTLLHLNPENHILLIMMHHIVCDGWSLLRVFIREIAALYRAFVHGQPSPLPPLPIQYADFALWQQQWAQNEPMQRQLAYWQKQLAGIPSVLSLPTDHPRPAVQTFHGAVQSLPLSPSLSQSLQALSLAEGTTLFMTLLAAFQVLLCRYTAQEDIAVGTPIANRNRTELEDLMGFFVNTLVLRTDLSGNPSFKQLLARVKEVALDAYAHQDQPFEQLADILRPERDMSHNPLFQVMFIMQNLPEEAIELPDSGLTLKLWEIGNRSAKFDLTLSVEQVGDRLVPSFEYNTDLFEHSTIQQMLQHLEILLDAAANNRNCPILDLPLLTPPEREQILFTWNQTEQPDCLIESCLHELIEEQVARTPAAAAVIYADQVLTYQELNQRANQLAHTLREMGVGPETPVGICLERSLEMVVGLLGILKAGGLYVPLDPTYPPERIAFMMADSQITVLLTQAHLVAQLPPSIATVLCLDSEWERIGNAAASNPVTTITPEHAIYMIYTSGTTGHPKGAVNTHRGLVNRLLWMQKVYQLTGQDRVLQKTPFSFDVSGWEFFWPLLVGASMVMAKPEGHKDSHYLIRLIQEQHITTLHFVPSMLYHFLAEPEVSHCTSLKRVICSGEALAYELQGQFFAHLPEVELHNLYGPTEAAIDVTAWRCQPNARQTVPIGQPIANTQIYLLDKRLHPTPVGVPGELHIGGVNLARHYGQRPALTAAKFIPDPFGPPGTRLYKTGDLARYWPDGTIEYLGRVDHQVKIRGFRIEPGEIEARLNQHPQIAASLVLVHKESPGNEQLLAYLVITQSPPPTITELRHFLQVKLPDYMIPAAFIYLDAFPLLPNGKIDRRALPAPDHARPDLAAGYTPPVTPIEETLADIWSGILGIDHIGIHDNFFELGGNSLLAVRLTARIQKQFDITIPLANLFQGATIESLARILERQTALMPPSSLVQIQPHGPKQPFFCVHPAGGNVLCYVDLARHLSIEQPFYGLQAQGITLQENKPLHTTIEAMAAHYVAELQAIQPVGPYLLGGWSMGGTIAFEMAQQLRAQNQEVAFLALFDTPAIFTHENAGDVDEAELLANIAHQYHMPLSLQNLRQIEPDNLLPYFIEQAKAANILPPDLPQLRHYLDIYKLHNRIVIDYQPQPYDGPVTLFRASEDFSEERDDPTLGWQPFVTQAVTIYPVPGNHGTMALEPHVRTLARHLQICLDEIGLANRGEK